MIYMQTPHGARMPVTVTRVHGGTYDADGDGAQFADVPVGVLLEDEDGTPLTAQEAFDAARADELSAFRARVEASGVLEGARRAEERLEKLLDVMGGVPILSGAVERLRSLEKGGDGA